METPLRRYTMPSGETDAHAALRRMRSVRRASISQDFEFQVQDPVPPIAHGGARIKVLYAGACYTDQQVVKSGQRRPRMSGIQDTSLFPGFEVSGIVDEISSTVSDTDVQEGDRVVVYPTDEEELTETGYSEYIVIKDAHDLIKIPDSLPLDVAAMLPSGALMAYAAVEKAKPFVEHQLQTLGTDPNASVNVLIVGAGGLSLWTLKIAEYFIGSNNHHVHLIVADPHVDKLSLAKKHGCYDVIHWDDSLHEEYITMRTRDVCHGGVDVVIDFVSSARTVSRSTQVLKEDGIMIVGGNSKYEVPLDLYSLALKHQSVIGVHKGTRQQLRELVQLVAGQQIMPPVYSVYSVDDVTTVFRQLSQCQIDGRAILRVSSDTNNDSSVFYPGSGSFNASDMSFNSSIEESWEVSNLVESPPTGNMTPNIDNNNRPNINFTLFEEE